MLDAKEAARKLTSVFPDMSYGELLQKLQSEEKFVWIKREISPKQEYQVELLGLPGIDFRHGQTRFYPYGAEPVHVVGFTDVDGKGTAGVEHSFNTLLNQGQTLQLAVDMRVQHILHRELAQAITDFNGIGGCGIVMDVHTGEIIAMVSLPDFDPHERRHRQRRGDGSIAIRWASMKWVPPSKCSTPRWRSIPAKVKLSDSFPVGNPIKIGKFTIHDFESIKPWLNVSEIFAYSSNIGSLQEALVVGTETQQKFLASLGLNASLAHRTARSRRSDGAAPVDADQHDDDRVRPRHVGQPDPAWQPALPRSSMAACCISRLCSKPPMAPNLRANA